MCALRTRAHQCQFRFLSRFPLDQLSQWHRELDYALICLASECETCWVEASPPCAIAGHDMAQPIDGLHSRDLHTHLWVQLSRPAAFVADCQHCIFVIGMSDIFSQKSHIVQEWLIFRASFCVHTCGPRSPSFVPTVGSALENESPSMRARHLHPHMSRLQSCAGSICASRKPLQSSLCQSSRTGSSRLLSKQRRVSPPWQHHAGRNRVSAPVLDGACRSHIVHVCSSIVSMLCCVRSRVQVWRSDTVQRCHAEITSRFKIQGVPNVFRVIAPHPNLWPEELHFSTQ